MIQKISLNAKSSCEKDLPKMMFKASDLLSLPNCVVQIRVVKCGLLWSIYHHHSLGSMFHFISKLQFSL
jgi:hypothetical protein